MKGMVKVAFAAGSVLLAATISSACGKSEAGQGSTSAADAAVAERRTLEIRAEAAGLIEPIRVVEVKSKASGEVLRLLVESGDYVERGALLAEIDPRDVRNGLAQAEADLEVARARLSTAEAQRKRAAELREANVITEQEFESAALDEANARAQLVKARTNLELARERMGDVTIRAPIAGTIIEKSVEIGQIIASASQNISGGTTLVRMADLSSMQVRTLVDETDIGKIAPGQTARVSVEAFPDRVFEGHVLKIEPQAVVEQNVTMFPVLVLLDNRDGLLKPGMNAEVAVEIARKEDVVTIPNAAVVSMRDAVAAGAILGLDENTIRTALRGNRSGSVSREVARQADGTAPNGEAGSAQNAGAPAATGQATSPTAECDALRERLRGQDRSSISEADRAKLRECMQRSGGRRGGPGGRGVGGDPEIRPGVVFVQGPNGPEPRRVMLGLNDWDHTEVVRGLEPGEPVILISVARLQQHQQQLMDRMRQRSGGPFPGAQGRRR